MTSKTETVADLVAELTGQRTDYDGSLMPDGAEPISASCGLLRIAASTLTSLEVERDRLREALEPFAALAKAFKPDDARKGLAFTTPNLSPSDFHRAFSALHALSGEGE